MSQDARLSLEIASAAARLVVEGGMEYEAAKHKAARSLGRRGPLRVALPGNEQVEDEVREHLQLFCAQTQPAELAALRAVAALWMQRLAPFRPHLSGAVWRGTATRRSAVHLDLYCDDPKSAEIELLNMNTPYEAQPQGEGRREVQVLTVWSHSAALGEPVTVHLWVRDLDDLRGALRPDARGRSWRGDLSALQRLGEVEQASPCQPLADEPAR